MTHRSYYIVAALLIATLPMSAAADRKRGDDWKQFGGNAQNFRAGSDGLADSWPEQGPKTLWSRELGDGYSGIVVENGRLYTMYRDAGSEVVVCLDGTTGATLWTTRYDASPADGHVTQFGEGPRSTPLISGKRVYTVGVSGVMNALNKKNGKILWTRDLWKELGGNILNHGYSSSPIEYGETIIVPVGGEGSSFVALSKKSGAVVWKNQSFSNSYSTPKLIQLGGRDHLVVFMADEIVGIDPNGGSLKWRVAFANQFQQNVSMPIWTADNILFFSTPQAGSKGVRLVERDGAVTVEELWHTRKIQFYHVTTVLDGDYVYGSTGMGSPNFMSAINVKTGEIAWRKRGFAKANVLHAGGRLMILDEDGKLTMADASPEDLKVLSEAQVLDSVAWTVPTVVGSTMFIRNKSKIVALDLS